jgi:D-lactate dehydrogenase (cytochrome)
MGLVGGQIPFDGELILSLTRLDKIREIDAASNTMTCEAGIVLAKAQTLRWRSIGSSAFA